MAEDVNMAGCRGLQLTIYAENLPNDVRKGYIKKLTYSHDDLLDPYELISGWFDDPSVWPDLQFGDIYRLLLPIIESPAWSVHRGEPDSLQISGSS